MCSYIECSYRERALYIRKYSQDAESYRTFPILSVVIGLINVARHAKVANLHCFICSHHAVPCGQIAVHKLFRCQIRHPVCDFASRLHKHATCAFVYRSVS